MAAVAFGGSDRRVSEGWEEEAKMKEKEKGKHRCLQYNWAVSFSPNVISSSPFCTEKP